MQKNDCAETTKLGQGPSTNSLSRFKSDVTDTHWSPQRKFVASVISQKWFEVAFGAMVLVSLTLAVSDTDYKAKDEIPPPWVSPLENILLLFYVIEISFRIFVFRQEYWALGQNVLDFLIVSIDVVFFFFQFSSVELPQVAFLRVLRLVKLTRTFHVLATQPELYILVQSFAGSLKATIFGCVFIAFALLVFGIIAVEFLRPLHVVFSPTCVSCPEAFDSVYYAMLTMLETVIVGDTWGELFLPFAKHHPVTLLFIIPVFVVIHFSLVNLILAVIVDAAQQARKLNDRQLVHDKERELHRQKTKLERFCKEMDLNGSGTVCLHELMTGYEENLDFRRCMEAMDITEEDLQAVFNILDLDGSGDCDYAEFTNQLFRMKNSDSHTMLVFIKHYVVDLKFKMASDMHDLNEKLSGGIQELKAILTNELQVVRDCMAKDLKRLEATSDKKSCTLRVEEYCNGAVDEHPSNEICYPGSIHELKAILTSELQSIRDIMAKGLTRPEATSDENSRSLRAQGKTYCANDAYESSLDASVAMSETILENPQGYLATGSELHVSREQISSTLEELKKQCERSCELLLAFTDTRSGRDTGGLSSFKICSGMIRQPNMDPNMQDGTGTAWQRKLARIQQGMQWKQ